MRHASTFCPIFRFVWGKPGTSDVWVGNKSAALGPSGDTRHFRGVEVLQAILAEGISGTPTEIVIAGTSAGAIGAAAHADAVRDLFPNATVLLVLDSVPPPFDIGVKQANSWCNVADPGNGTAIASLAEAAWGSPLASFATTVAGIGREGLCAPCLFSVQCMLDKGFIPATVPTFIIQPANDMHSMIVGIDHVSAGVQNGEAPTLLNLRDRFHVMLQSLKAPVQTPIRELRKSTFPVGLFAPGCVHHGMLTQTVPSMPGMTIEITQCSQTMTVDSGTELLDFVLTLDETDLWSDDGCSWTRIVVDGQTLEDALSGWVTAVREDNRSTFTFEDGCLSPSCNPTCLEEFTFKSVQDMSGWISITHALSGAMVVCSVGMMLAAHRCPLVDRTAELAHTSVADSAHVLVESHASRDVRLKADFAVKRAVSAEVENGEARSLRRGFRRQATSRSSTAATSTAPRGPASRLAKRQQSEHWGPCYGA